MKKFAYILMGTTLNPSTHTAEFEVSFGKICIFTVRNANEAKEKVAELWHEGFGAIELCGAFNRNLARELIDLTNNEVAIGYSIHQPEQDKLFTQFFDKL